MINRRIMMAGLAAGTASLFSACGTIIYPDRTYQQEHGNLDPAIVILDGIGLFFFVIPGLVAFAVDLTTGALFFPADHIPGDRENTIFERYDASANPTRQEIERGVALQTGNTIDLTKDDVRIMELQGLDQFWLAYDKLSGQAILASR